MKDLMKVAALFVVVASVLTSLLLVNFGRNPEPRANTPEYDQAHGIVRGEDNLITVGGVKLLIPALTYFRVYSYENIEKGKADKVVLSILLDELFEREVSRSYGSPAQVRIEIENFINNPDFVWELNRIDSKKGKGVNIESVGLTEYTSDSNSWLGTLYVTNEETSTFRDGKPIVFSCKRDQGGDLSLCRTLYIPYKGLDISFYFNGKELMPHWRFVTRRVHEYVDGLIIER